MKKLFIFLFAMMMMGFISCQNSSNGSVRKDSAATNSLDSAANNGILPPSASPDNTNNSSLADTTYKAKDSSGKVKK